MTESQSKKVGRKHKQSASDLVFLHVIIPQGEKGNPKKEQQFSQFLENLYQSARGVTVSLEFFGYMQYTYLYIVVPNEVADLIEGLVYSTYPDCEIVPSEDYVEKHADSKAMYAGTSLYLFNTDVLPTLTHTDFEVDSLSGIFSVLSKVDKNEQVWIQLLVRPQVETFTYHFWRNVKLKWQWIKRLFRLKDYVRLKNRKEFLAEQDKAAIEKNAEHDFAAEIKIVTSALDLKKAKQKLSSIVRAYAQFERTDYNGFRAGRTVTGTQVVSKFQKRKMGSKYLLSSKEIATLYHFPNADHVPHVVHVLARRSEPPQDLPTKRGKELSFFGMSNYHNQYRSYGIKRADRQRHLYLVGKSGCGKSKLMELLIYNDIINGEGVGVLDPHGDLVDAVMSFVPENRIKDVIYFDPGDTEYPIAFNPLEAVDDKYKMQVTIGFIDIFKKLFGDNWTYRLEHVLRYTTLALLDSPNTTVLSILKMLTDKNYRQSIVSRIKDDVVKNFWVNEFAGWSEKFDAEAITPLLNKVGQFVSTGMIRNIIAQPENTFQIEDVMNNKKILLMKVSKGLLGEENSSLIGSMIITKVYQAAMARAGVKESERSDFYFYVDEFQNFATDTFAEILSEARKYHLCLTIAHQYMGQLIEEVRATVFGNVGSMINFRLGAEDAAIMEKEYEPTFKVRDMINLGVRDYYSKMSIDGNMYEAFSGRTLDMVNVDYDHSEKIKDMSRKKYAKPLEEVIKLQKKWDEGGDDSEENTGPQMAAEFEEPLI